MTPAAAETDMAKEITPERRADIVARIPMGRFVEAEEIAAMVAFLASDDCTFLHRRRFRRIRRPGHLLGTDSNMALAGKGAIIIWNDITPEGRDQFYDWHIHEHIPERLACRVSRGGRYIAASADTKPEFLTLYEIDDPSVATSAPYLARLNNPTDWTKRATAHFRNTARALTEVVRSEGEGQGGMMATIRFDGSDEGTAAFARVRDGRVSAADVARMTRVTGMHLCATNGAASAARTAESRDRADIMTAPIGALLIEGCDEVVLRASVAHFLERCEAEGSHLHVGYYRLEYAALHC